MQVVDKNGTLQDVYKISDLKKLNIGDKVITEFHKYDEDDCEIQESIVEDINDENIYFDNGFDFPFFKTPDVVGDFAVQDSMDEWKFSVYKDNN